MTNPQQTLILNGEKLKVFPLKLGIRQDVSPLLFNIVLELLATAMREEKHIKGTQIGNDIVKLPLFSDDMILHKENPKDATRKLLDLTNEFGIVAKDTKLMHLTFPYTNNQHKIREVKETIPFGIATKIIKCLEINLPKKAKNLYSENYKMLMKETKHDANRWKDISCS